MKRLFLLSIVPLLVAGCAEPGETTGVASATGGAIGAGLGALIGGQTGNAGAGLVIGAVGGAATGAVVGNAIEAQQVAVQTQDDAIEKQDKLISIQRREIDALRNASHDRVTFKGLENSQGSGAVRARPAEGVFASPESGVPARGLPLVERSITPSQSLPAVGMKNGTVAGSSVPPAWSTAMEDSFIPSSTECAKGRDEIRKSDGVADTSDKLFHVRRALRLCPDAAPFHNKLGELYVAMSRQSDAVFSFKEAIRLRSDYAPARTNLTKLGRIS